MVSKKSHRTIFLRIRYQVRAATLLLFILFLCLSMKPMITGIVTSFLSISLCFFAKNHDQALTENYKKSNFFQFGASFVFLLWLLILWYIFLSLIFSFVSPYLNFLIFTLTCFFIIYIAGLLWLEPRSTKYVKM